MKEIRCSTIVMDRNQEEEDVKMIPVVEVDHDSFRINGKVYMSMAKYSDSLVINGEIKDINKAIIEMKKIMRVVPFALTTGASPGSCFCNFSSRVYLPDYIDENFKEQMEARMLETLKSPDLYITVNGYDYDNKSREQASKLLRLFHPLIRLVKGKEQIVYRTLENA